MDRLSDGESSGRGFTLIELLMVVAIVSVLAGLLIPAVASVRTQAWRAQCASNMRNCTLAVLAYATDWDGLLPYRDEMGGTDTGGPFWPQRTSPYLDDSYIQTLYSGNNVYHCSLAQSEVRNQWNYPDRFAFHFGMNQNLYTGWHNGWAGMAGWTSGWRNNQRPVRGSKARSQAVLLADGHVGFFTGMSYVYDYADTGLARPWPVDTTVVGASMPITGHGRAITRSHLDGHISSTLGTYIQAEQNAEWAR